MEQRNCRKCAKVFAYISGYPVCKECKEEDDAQYKKVREFIWNTPGATVEQVSEALGMEKQQILRYLREERLEITKTNNIFIFCEICGVGIKTGRFCDRCKIRIENELKLERNKSMADAYYYNESQEKKIRYLKSEDKR